MTVTSDLYDAIVDCIKGLVAAEMPLSHVNEYKEDLEASPPSWSIETDDGTIVIEITVTED